MTKKNARKTAARERQAKVGGSYTSHLESKEEGRPPYKLVDSTGKDLPKHLGDPEVLIRCMGPSGMTVIMVDGVPVGQVSYFSFVDDVKAGYTGPVATLKKSDSSAWSREQTARLKTVPWLKVEKEPDWYQVPLTEREKVDREVQVQREMHTQGVTSDNELRGPLGDELRRERQPVVDELVRQGHMAKSGLGKRVDEAFLILNSGIHFKGKLAPTREALLARIQQALQVLSPHRAVLEQAGDELLSEKLDEMFGPAPNVDNSSAAQTLKYASDILDKGLAREAAATKNPDKFTVNDPNFDQMVRTPHASERQTILNFLRWLRTSGPDAKTHDLVEAYCDAESRVEEYVKGGTARK